MIDQRNDVIRVPNQALRYVPGGLAGAGQLGQAQIWVLRDGQPDTVAVVAGLDDDSFTEIVSGDVKPGDLVVTAEQLVAPRKPSRHVSLANSARTSFAGQACRNQSSGS